ncbi:MAG: TlpA disulfide reductase family protein [Campylobacterota bacterium]|nr:TlpA disulfide reductase family protein [Campylobacterota bacterium]
MKFKNIAIFSILTIALITGCDEKKKIEESDIVTNNTKTEQKQETKENKPFTFNLVTSNGKDLKIIADMKNGWEFVGHENKVVLLDFFGTWCPPCKAEIPHLNNIRGKLKEDFEIIGIDVGQRGGGLTPAEELTQFIKDFKIKYPVTSGADNGILFSAVSELNPSGSIPFMILFNKQGQFVRYYVGMKPEEMLMKDIEAAIKMK